MTLNIVGYKDQIKNLINSYTSKRSILMYNSETNIIILFMVEPF